MTLSFPCPNCHYTVEAPAQLAGKKGRCKQCQAIFQVPADVSEPEPALASDSLEISCPECATTVRVPAAARGKKGRCSSCQAIFPVPTVVVGSSAGLVPLEPTRLTSPLVPMGTAPTAHPPVSPLIPIKHPQSVTTHYGVPQYGPPGYSAPSLVPVPYIPPLPDPLAAGYPSGSTNLDAAPIAVVSAEKGPDSGYTPEDRLRAAGLTMLVLAGTEILCPFVTIAGMIWFLSLLFYDPNPSTPKTFSQLLPAGIESALPVLSVCEGMLIALRLRAFTNPISLAIMIFYLPKFIILFGAVNMLKVRKHTFAQFAAFLCLIPFLNPFVLLGIPVGIWVLTVLRDPAVERLFDRKIMEEYEHELGR